MLTNLFVITKAYPFLSIGATPLNLLSTLIGWQAVNFLLLSYIKNE